MDIRPARLTARGHAHARPRRPPRRAAALLALGLVLPACGADGAEPTQQDTPPLDEPTDTPDGGETTASPEAAETRDEVEDVGDEGAEPKSEQNPTQQEDGLNGEGSRNESDAIDVSEFSSESQESRGFPDMLTAFPDDGEELLLSEIRTGEHEGYDRIVFEHAGDGAPGWQAEYVDEALEPGSGFPLEIEADAILYLSAVGLVPKNAGSEQGQLEVFSWTGEQGTVVQEVMTTFVHHGTASYYVGLDRERDYRVSVWEHPDGPRLIIDFLR